MKGVITIPLEYYQLLTQAFVKSVDDLNKPHSPAKEPEAKLLTREEVYHAVHNQERYLSSIQHAQRVCAYLFDDFAEEDV